jgi:hypothetical protein
MNVQDLRRPGVLLGLHVAAIVVCGWLLTDAYVHRVAGLRRAADLERRLTEPAERFEEIDIVAEVQGIRRDLDGGLALNLAAVLALVAVALLLALRRQDEARRSLPGGVAAAGPTPAPSAPPPRPPSTR